MSYLKCISRRCLKLSIVFICALSISLGNFTAFSKEQTTSQESARLKQELDFLYKQAIVYFNNKDYEGAADLFEKMLTLNPNDKRAKLYLDEKIPKAAKQHKTESLYNEAITAYENQDYDKASDLFEEVLAIDPDNKKARRYLFTDIPKRVQAADKHKIKSLEKDALAFFYKGNYQEANIAFKELLSLDPDNEKAKLYIERKIPQKLKIDFLYRKAFTYFYDEDYLMAKKAFQDILAIDPSQEKARTYLQRKIPLRMKHKKEGALYTMPPAFVEGETVYSAMPSEIVKKDAEGFVVIKNKSPIDILEDADYLYQVGEYEEALVLYSKVYNETTDPLIQKRAELARSMVNSLLKAERKPPKEAAKDLEQAVKIKERLQREHISSLYQRAVSNFNNKNYDVAKDVFTEILSMDPNQKRARIYLEERIPYKLKEQRKSQIAMLYKRANDAFYKKDYPRAEVLYREILSLDPDQKGAKEYVEVKIPQAVNKARIDSLYALAERYFNEKNYKKSLELYNEILSLDPNQKKARLYAQEKIPKAMKEAKIAALYNEALSLYQNENYEKSAKVFRKIVALDHKQYKANEYLKRKIPHQIKMKRKAQIDSLYDEGIALYKSGDYKAATRAFQKILVIDPNQRRAREYVDSRIPRQLKSMQKKKIRALYDKAHAQFKNKQYKQSARTFKEILTIDPDQREAQKYLTKIIPQKLEKMKRCQLKERKHLQSERERHIAMRRREMQEKQEMELSRRSMMCDVLSSYEPREAYAPREVVYQPKPVKKDHLRKPKRYPKDGAIGYLYEEAFLHYNKGEFRLAERYFKKILAADPDQPVARVYLDSIYELAAP